LTRLRLSANDAAHRNARSFSLATMNNAPVLVTGGAGRQGGTGRGAIRELVSLGYRTRAQWVAEQIFEANGMDGVHLRMKCFFLENLLLVDAPGIRLFNRIANAWGNTSLHKRFMMMRDRSRR
jgi:hypothetical protein